MASRPPSHKQRLLIFERPSEYPYAAKMTFVLGSDTQLDFEEELCLLAGHDSVVTISTNRTRPDEEALGIKRLTAAIEGFSSASEAEVWGQKLSLGLLWAATSKRFAMRLEYHTPLPALVYDRTRKTRGDMLSAHGVGVWKLKPNDFTIPITQVLTSRKLHVDNLLLSMELFSSARFETTERAQFIGLVSALEPLADARPLGSDVDVLVAQFREALKQSELSTRLKASLDGRIQFLRQESISQAIARVVQTLLPSNEGVLETIRQSYDLRSKMLHKGKKVSDLQARSRAVEDSLRQLYAAAIGSNLATPIPST